MTGAKGYCNEDISLIENYEKAKADNFKGWCCHHRLETHTPDGELRDADVTAQKLIDEGLYYNRPANELIFMRKEEHLSLHKKGKPKNKKANKMFTEKPEFSEQDQKKWSMLYMRLSRKEYSELDDVSKRVFAWHEAYVKLLWEKRKILDSQC
mgnify:CR=1 FL=1